MSECLASSASPVIATSKYSSEKWINVAGDGGSRTNCLPANPIKNVAVTSL